MELRVGNKYRLGRKIGSGSFGDIYLGTTIHTGEEVGPVEILLKKFNFFTNFSVFVYLIDVFNSKETNQIDSNQS